MHRQLEPQKEQKQAEEMENGKKMLGLLHLWFMEKKTTRFSCLFTNALD